MFGGGGDGGSISGATDVFFSTPVDNEVLTYDGGTQKWVNANGGSGSAGPGSTGAVLVASVDAPAAVKAYADYVCDGTADQVQINSAISDAAPLQSRNAGMPAGAKQQGKVQLTGGRFNISAPITMRTGVWLTGMGFVTELRSISNNGAGMITLAAPSDHLCHVSNMYLEGNYGSGGTCSAIDFDMTASGNTSGYPTTNPDSYHLIADLYIHGFDGSASRHGVYLHASGTANNRGNIIRGLQIRDTGGNGIFLSAASDSFIEGCHVGGSANSGYRIETGNTKVSNCKSFYSDTYGFYFSSGRGVVVGCESQDDATGFMFDGAPYTASGLVADTSSAAGIQVSADRLVLNGFSIFLRGSARYPTQARGLYIDGTYADLSLTGQVDDSNITTPIQGTPGARSFMRVSDGTSLVSVG